MSVSATEKMITKTQYIDIAKNNSKFNFIIDQQSQHNQARLGYLVTPHGIIQTPEFIFCATKAAIKSVSPVDMQSNGAKFILSNTYHLMIYPGAELISKFGGLHKFIGWDGPMLTDSGGFQIFSLGHGSVADEIKGKRHNSRNPTLLKITEQGATFRSYLDGSIHTLTPEKAMQVQHNLGADLILVFDECTPFHVERNYTKQSMERSHRWAVRSINEFNRHNNPLQALYGIVQGGVYTDLRQQSCDFVNSNSFFGQAIGGSLGSSKNQMYDIVGYSKSLLNPTKPTHLLGIGDIDDIFSGVAQGIDTFDCVHPTRLARHGGALVRVENLPSSTAKNKNHINLSNRSFKLDNQPIEPDCPCSTCQRYSKGYLHYLLKAKELLAYQLITIHNVSFMSRLMAAIRSAIKSDCLATERSKWTYE